MVLCSHETSSTRIVGPKFGAVVAMCVVGVVCAISSVSWGKTHPTRSLCLSLCEGRHGGFTPASCRGFKREGRLQNLDKGQPLKTDAPADLASHFEHSSF